MSSKKPETLFKEKVFKDLDTLDECWYEKIQQVTIRGTPDVLICIKGVFVALELKKDRFQEPDKLQLYKLQQIKKARGLTYTVYPENWKSTFSYLQKIK